MSTRRKNGKQKVTHNWSNTQNKHDIHIRCSHNLTNRKASE